MSQLASCLKKDFKPFLPNLMEALYRDAKRDLDFKIVDATEEELEEKDGDEKVPKHIQKIAMKIQGMEGQKMISMNTVALENKVNAT